MDRLYEDMEEHRKEHLMFFEKLDKKLDKLINPETIELVARSIEKSIYSINSDKAQHDFV